jgi:hypothetical protein
MTTPTFADVQAILNTIANCKVDDVRFGIYGRHDTQGRYSWETEQDLVNSIAHFPTMGGDIPLFSKVDYRGMTDTQLVQHCRFLQMISPAGSGPMPRVAPGSGRRKATEAELVTIRGWIRTLNLAPLVS